VLAVMMAVAVMLYAAEAYLAYEEWEIELGTGGRIRRVAEKSGAAWDKRDRVEVIRDLRSQGRDAHPAMAPSVFTDTDGIVVNGEKFFPFGGISKTTNVFCNEMGEYSIYESDEHGFNNPYGSWSGKVDAVLIGDSFIHGACLKPGDDIASQLRKTGLRTLNLGIGGTGPLFYSAVLKEYAESVKPRVVVWTFYAVDIRDPVYEKNSPLLMRYLDDRSFSQGLINDQPRVDRLLRSYYETEYQKRLDSLTAARLERRAIITRRLLSNGLALTKLRERLRNLGGRDVVTEGREEEKLLLFEQTLRLAKERTESWGGRLVFMYLPDWYTWGAAYDTYGIKIDENFLLRQDVLKIARQIVPVVDIQADVFEKHSDPLSLFNWRTYGHYTLEGYRLVSQRLGTFLREQTDVYRRAGQ
jgi:hypothetical protein